MSFTDFLNTKEIALNKFLSRVQHVDIPSFLDHMSNFLLHAKGFWMVYTKEIKVMIEIMSDNQLG
jgi:hypothetical protein